MKRELERIRVRRRRKPLAMRPVSKINREVGMKKSEGRLQEIQHLGGEKEVEESEGRGIDNMKSFSIHYI